MKPMKPLYKINYYYRIFGLLIQYKSILLHSETAALFTIGKANGCKCTRKDLLSLRHTADKPATLKVGTLKRLRIIKL